MIVEILPGSGATGLRHYKRKYHTLDINQCDIEGLSGASPAL
jgi:hypothetical protein